MGRNSQSALARYMARRGAAPVVAARPRFAHWRWVRLSVLALAAAATWALVGRPREEVPVNLTYELDLAGAADGRLVIGLNQQPPCRARESAFPCGRDLSTGVGGRTVMPYDGAAGRAGGRRRRWTSD